jgi:starch synthase (maltosyl-transferring)
MRPNFFVNTPDILHASLQYGGPPAFKIRAVLASMLAPTWGVYAGFELFEHVAVRPGSEEYLDSEKYEIRQRALAGPLLAVAAQLNEIRRTHDAFQRLDNVTFVRTENDALIGYVKRGSSEALLTVVNLDPHRVQEGVVIVADTLGLPPVFAVVDLLSGERFDWRLGRNFVRLDPGVRAGHLLLVQAPR